MNCPNCSSKTPHKMPWDFSNKYICKACSKISTSPKAYPLIAFLIAAALTYGAKLVASSFGYSLPWYVTLSIALIFIYVIDRVALKLVPSDET
jgi:DNA-directed RNA polymerase subunit RPC12/RpoP